MTEKVRILQVIDRIGNAGAETLQRTLAESIDRTRFELHVCGLRPRPGSVTLPALQSLGIPTVVLNQRASYDLPALTALVRYVRSNRIDLIHTHLLAADIMGRMAGFITRRPGISTVHNGVPDLEGQPRRRQLLLRWTTHLWCRRLVVVSDLLRPEIAAWYGVSLRKVVAIPNAIDTERFKPLPPEQRAQIKQALVGGDHPVVINIARLVPEKAQHVLLRAARTVADARPDVRFVFAGEGPLKENLQTLTAELGLLSQVQFLDFRADIDRLLAASDVFVLSSVSEGMPVSLLEAMSAGCPSVATRVGGIPQVLREGETGLIVPPGEPAVQAEALLALLNDPERARAMGAAARRTAVREYNNRAWARKLENLYLHELGLAGPQRRGSAPHPARP